MVCVMGRPLHSVRFGHWNLEDNPGDGYSPGTWQSDDLTPVMGGNQLRVVTVSLAGFDPLDGDANKCSAYIGVTYADGQISADLGNPLSWPRIAIGVFQHFTVTMVVYRARAGFVWTEHLYDDEVCTTPPRRALRRRA